MPAELVFAPRVSDVIGTHFSLAYITRNGLERHGRSPPRELILSRRSVIPRVSSSNSKKKKASSPSQSCGPRGQMKASSGIPKSPPLRPDPIAGRGPTNSRYSSHLTRVEEQGNHGVTILLTS